MLSLVVIGLAVILSIFEEHAALLRELFEVPDKFTCYLSDASTRQGEIHRKFSLKDRGSERLMQFFIETRCHSHIP
jgi:hypothetical protein